MIVSTNSRWRTSINQKSNVRASSTLPNPWWWSKNPTIIPLSIPLSMSKRGPGTLLQDYGKTSYPLKSAMLAAIKEPERSSRSGKKVVEVRRVELLSENISISLSSSGAGGLSFAFPNAHQQAWGIAISLVPCSTENSCKVFLYVRCQVFSLQVSWRWHACYN